MKLLFVADPLESFKIHKDTTFAMMREAQRRGHNVAGLRAAGRAVAARRRVTAHVRDIRLTGRQRGLVRGDPVPRGGR
jgi:glutathione synthase